jgi:protein-disulfide isomerase-like protein with CxxC motif
MREERSVQASPSNGGDKWRKQALSIRLRTIMAEKDLTVTATAKLVQQRLSGEPFNAVNITHYRAGRSLPRPRILRALSDALGVDPQDLAPLPTADADNFLAANGGEVIETEVSPKAGRKRTADESINSIPAFNLEDMLGGEAWLQINQRLSWPTVIKILQVLKGEDAESS